MSHNGNNNNNKIAIIGNQYQKSWCKRSKRQWVMRPKSRIICNSATPTVSVLLSGPFPTFGQINNDTNPRSRKGSRFCYSSSSFVFFIWISAHLCVTYFKSSVHFASLSFCSFYYFLLL